MSINFQIPHSSRTIPTANVFSAAFGASIPGKYSLADATQNQIVIGLERGNLYLVERLSVGATISPQDYFAAFDPANIPLIYLKKKLTSEPINQKPIPIVQFFDGLELGFWIRSDKKDDSLTMSMTGVFNQISDLVGIPSIGVSVSFIIWQIDEKKFNSDFRNSIEGGLAENIRGVSG